MADEQENRPQQSERPQGDRPQSDRAQGDGAPQFDRKKSQGRRYRKKVLDTRNLVIDYKHPETLERFISKTGKILPRRMTGATAKIQRKIAREIKCARQINLLPFIRR